MQNELYEFRREDAFRFAEFIGHKAFQRGDELVFVKCPYCGNTSDKKNKFAINLETGQFNCFRASCGAKGNMVTLSHDFGFKISEDMDRYTNRADYNNRFRHFRDAHRKIEATDPAVEYLKSRGISEEICREYEITTRKDDDGVLIFPFKDENGEMTFVKYRNIHPKEGQSKEWCERNCKPILFGMNHCDLTDSSLVITEGQMDSLSVVQAGFKNAVSVPIGCNGFTWIPHCWDWMQNFSDIVVFGDCENGRVSLSETLAKRFPKKVRIVKVSDYQGLKDANDILRQIGPAAILKAINNAEPVKSRRYKFMETVEAVDIERVETIKTNIRELDEILTGGFKVGSLVILSGKRGNGKSTVASYFGVEALHQNFNTFIYSGELTDSHVKNWIDRQIYGSSSLSNSQIDLVSQWYAHRLMIYSNDFTEDDISEMESLLETIEEVIQRHGVRMIILDNLMTALDDVPTNDGLYQCQRKFVRALSKMAKQLEVVIILVAHPRKSNSEFENDSVSGSSVITDAADVVMSYDKIVDSKDPDHDKPDIRLMTVTKNRLTGKVGKIKLWFSEDSKRITGKDKNFVREYLKTEPKFEPAIGDPFEDLVDG